MILGWFQRMKLAGVDSLGMHLEAVTPEVRARIMPGKAEVPVETYMEAFAAAVEVFGWGQVSTYILAGLGDSFDAIVSASDRLIELGVYPFVVPFVPIGGTPPPKSSGSRQRVDVRPLPSYWQPLASGRGCLRQR